MKNKEARKLIKFGDSSHVLSLPKDWIEKNKLEKGDLVFIDENDYGQLTLSASDKEIKIPEKSTILSTEKKEWSTLKREIVSAYLNNYTTIKIAGKDLNQKIKPVREIIRNLPTMEVVNQSKEELIAKVFLDPEKIKFEELTTRIDIMIRALYEDIKQLILKKKILDKEIDELMSRDDDINGLFYLSLKIFREKLENPGKMKYSTLPELFDSWHANFNLEHIADKIKEIISLVKANNLSSNQKVKENIVTIIEGINDLHINTMKSRFNKDKEFAMNLAEEKSKINKLCDELSKNNYNKRGVPELCEKLKSITSRIHSIGRRVYA